MSLSLNRTQYPILEGIEKEHLSYIRERREMAARKMLLEDADDLSVFLGVPDVPKQKPNENEIQDGEEEINGEKEEEMSAGVQRQRFASRQDRYEHKQRSQATNGTEEDGYESGVPLDLDLESDFQEAVSKLKGRVENMMSDVHAKDYKDPSRGIWLAILFEGDVYSLSRDSTVVH
jgi:GC-rich sequence DNA-binding factor